MILLKNNKVQKSDKLLQTTRLATGIVSHIWDSSVNDTKQEQCEGPRRKLVKNLDGAGLKQYPQKEARGVAAPDLTSIFYFINIMTRY